MSHRIRRVQQLGVAPAPLVRRFGLFAERLEVRTNDRRILAAAEASFGRFEVPYSGEPVVIRLVVDDPVAPSPAAPAAPLDARSLGHETAGHLFSISLGSAGRAVVDVATGFGMGSVSSALADQTGLLRYAIVEAMALAMLTGGRGYVPIHASCVVRDGIGIILQAPAGTGKSTLALACARRGWGLLAEDVVFARPADGPMGREPSDLEQSARDGDGPGGDGPLEVWGMPWTQRLLPDATRFFPELATATARLQANGEQKLELDLDEHAPGTAAPRATAGPIVILARDSGGPTRAEWLSPLATPTEVEILWPWESGWTAAHERTVARLLEHGLLRLHLNSTPDEAVTALEAALEPAAAR
jgi:hypothetical protein